MCFNSIELCILLIFSIAFHTLNILKHSGAQIYYNIGKVTLAREISHVERSDGHGGERQITLL